MRGRYLEAALYTEASRVSLAGCINVPGDSFCLSHSVRKRTGRSEDI